MTNKMTQYNTLNVKVSDSKLNKLKSRIKNGTEVTLNLPSKGLEIPMMKTIFDINYYQLIITNYLVTNY